MGREKQYNDDKYEEEDMEDEEEVAEDDLKKVGRPQLVNDDEEALLLQQILVCQQHGNCMTPREARWWLEQVVFNRGKVVTLNRQWWYNFKEKYDRILKVMKIHCLEYRRFEVTKEQVVDDFGRLSEELAKCPFPPIIINKYWRDWLLCLGKGHIQQQWHISKTVRTRKKVIAEEMLAASYYNGVGFQTAKLIKRATFYRKEF